jgi:SHS2 domain-containing protein
VKKNFEYLEHTADLGFLACGKTLKALFANAAEALMEVMVSVETIQMGTQKKIDVTAPSLDSLLVRWLNELLYIFDTEGLLFRRYDIDHLDTFSLKATAMGEQVDPIRHVTKTEIKAVTYHQLYVRKKNGQWECRVILDL